MCASDHDAFGVDFLIRITVGGRDYLISPVADQVIPSSYGYSDKEVNPEGIMVRSAQMKEYDFDANP
ncbi:MAG: hypothetical protein J6S22_02510, partial [Clostridia bacterium]|nr:hypothetical protein [Clostridia bacterium]